MEKVGIRMYIVVVATKCKLPQIMSYTINEQAQNNSKVAMAVNEHKDTLSVVITVTLS